MDAKGWVLCIGGLLVAFGWIWYYASLGKSISEAEKKAGRDLTYELNPFTGKPMDNDKDNDK